MNRHLFYTDGNSLLSFNRISLVAFRDEVRALNINSPTNMEINIHGKCFIMTGVRKLIANIREHYKLNAVFSLMIPVSQKDFQSIKAKARTIPTPLPVYPLGSKRHPYYEHEDDYGIVQMGGQKISMDEKIEFSKKANKFLPLIWDSEETVGTFKPTI